MQSKIFQLEATLDEIHSEIGDVKTGHLELLAVLKEKKLASSKNVGYYCKPCEKIIKTTNFCNTCEWRCRCGRYNSFEKCMLEPALQVLENYIEYKCFMCQEHYLTEKMNNES